MSPRIGAALVVGSLAVPAAVAADTAAPIPRFHRVDGRLYRGAQPDAEGFRYLRDLGVRTVVNLRDDDEARTGAEQRIVESLGMRYIHLPVRDGNFFTRSRTIPGETIRSFFAVVDGAQDGPVFLHCRRGADRTGALVGFYRIARHRWDNARAYAEARAIGMRSWYTGLKKQIYGFAGVP
ncbi:MAG: protein tyrosine phosphatase family protein [Acidobacteria bacterium]|nr:protein tyrosine phosphatase family protein [Acidobacteriota bacterium]